MESLDINEFIRKEVREFPNEVPFDPVVSVCVITYNHVNFIEKCLTGIIDQKTNYKMEILIGDDGSDDGTREICIEYAKKYPTLIRLFLHDRDNVMYVCNRPTGRFNILYLMNRSRGRYIAFCEGDDQWTDRNKLQIQLDYLESHPDFSMTSHAVKTDYLDVEKKNPFVSHKIISTFEDIVLHGHFIPSLSMVFRKETIDHIPLWFKDLAAGDIPFMMLILSKGKNYYFEKIMGIKRKHKGGVTQCNKDEQYKNFLIKNKLFLYENMNEYLGKRYNRIFKPVITCYHIQLTGINFRERSIGAATRHIVKGFIISPRTFLKRSFEIIFH